MTAMRYTVEQYEGQWPPTFEELKRRANDRTYRGPRWREIVSCFPGMHRDWDLSHRPRRWHFRFYNFAFTLRFRTGDKLGYFGPTTKDGKPNTGARWCWPWQWERLYYAVRFPEAKQS